MQIRQPLEFPVKPLRLWNCQIPRFHQTWPAFKKLLGSEHGSYLYAWLETAAAWLMWRQNPVPDLCVRDAVAGPCTCLIWAGREAWGRRASQNGARSRLSKAGGDRPGCSCSSDSYLRNGLQLFYMLCKDLCNPMSCMCRFYLHQLAASGLKIQFRKGKGSRAKRDQWSSVRLI